MKVGQVVKIVIFSLGISGCAAGGAGGQSTVYNQGGTVGGSITSTAGAGGNGGSIPITTNIAVTPDAIAAVFPAKAGLTAAALTASEIKQVQDFCKDDTTEKCVKK